MVKHTIQRIALVDEASFVRSYVHGSQPVVITDLTAGWKALKYWSNDFFAQNYADSLVGTMHLNGEQCDVNTYRETDAGRNTVAQTLSSWSNLATATVIASPIENFGQNILQDFTPPPYFANGKFKRNRIYIGPKGIVTPLHHDLPENIYTQIKGTKRITLFAPSDRPYLYPNSLFSKHPNFSQIDLLHPDLARFPLFAKATPYVVDLAAGETLFIPSLWWHHLQNIENSIAMNFWWSTGWRVAAAWSAAMYKRLFKA